MARIPIRRTDGVVQRYNVKPEINAKFKSEEMKNLAVDLLKHGFKIYTSDNMENVGYFHYVKDGNIGYAQEEYFGGISFSSVHKPNRQTGTGFRITEEGIPNATVQDAMKAFITAPTWAKDKNSVVKYKSWDDYLSTPTNGILTQHQIMFKR
jgi:hypothetical protein